MMLSSGSTIKLFLVLVCMIRSVLSFSSTIKSVHRTTLGSRSQSSSLFMTKRSAETSTTTTTASSMIAGPPLPPISSTAKRLFLVRHGEVINPGGPDRSVYYGAMDVPSSALGELEAQVAAQYLSQYPLAAVISSPLKRAVYGAKQVLELQTNKNDSRKSDIVVLDGLKELDRGAWCGLTKEEIGADLLARFDACDESVTPGNGGESYRQLKARVMHALEQQILSDVSVLAPGQAACIVSHLQVTRCILSDALNIPVEEMVRLKVATASITCIDYEPDGKMPTVHFQSFKPNVGLQQAKDGAN